MSQHPFERAMDTFIALRQSDRSRFDKFKEHVIVYINYENPITKYKSVFTFAAKIFNVYLSQN